MEIFFFANFRLKINVPKFARFISEYHCTNSYDDMGKETTVLKINLMKKKTIMLQNIARVCSTNSNSRANHMLWVS